MEPDHLKVFLHFLCARWLLLELHFRHKQLAGFPPILTAHRVQLTEMNWGHDNNWGVDVEPPNSGNSNPAATNITTLHVCGFTPVLNVSDVIDAFGFPYVLRILLLLFPFSCIYYVFHWIELEHFTTFRL